MGHDCVRRQQGCARGSRCRLALVQHPRLRLGTVVVGATIPTDFARVSTGSCSGLRWTSGPRRTRPSPGGIQDLDTDNVGQVLAGLFVALLLFPGVNMERIGEAQDSLAGGGAHASGLAHRRGRVVSTLVDLEA